MRHFQMIFAVLLSFNSVALHAELNPPPPTAAAAARASQVPRRPYWCAALLSTPPYRNVERFEALESLNPSRAALKQILESTRPKTWLRRFVAWIKSLEDFHLEDQTLTIADVAAHAPDKNEQTLLRKVLFRLQEIEDDSKQLPNSAFPMRNVIRGHDAIRTYLLALKAEATRLEDEHAADVAPQMERPQRTPIEAELARQGLFWKDLGRGTLYAGIGIASAYAVSRGWTTSNAVMTVAGALAGVGIAGPGLQKSFKNLRVSYNTYLDDLDQRDLESSRRDHEARAIRALEQVRHIDAMLASLDADPATRARSFVYHGYTIELPMRNVSTFGQPRRITAEAIIAGERRAEAYDPVLNRWVIVDQIFQFDEHGEPILITFMREQLSYGRTQVYDAWINNGGFMP